MKKAALLLLFFTTLACEMRNPNVLPKEFQNKNYQEVIFNPEDKSEGRMPMYPGGADGLYADIQENLIYPEAEIDNGREGEVTVEFIVSLAGKVHHISIVEGINENFDNAAIKAIESLKAWYPGHKNGLPVLVTYQIPIRFELPSGEKRSELKMI